MEPRHFKDPAVLQRIIQEILGRFGRPHKELIEEIVAQLRHFFATEFRGASPTRFHEVTDGIVRPRFLVGLSGGIDSSVVTALAVRAVGVDQVMPVNMPGHPDDDSADYARLLCDHLGFKDGGLQIIPILKIVRALVDVMDDLGLPQAALGGHHDRQSTEQKIRSGNFASRARIGVLYHLQRSVRGRILGTMNRTEYTQGYGCKFGTPDAYDVGVLDGLYKADIYEIARILDIPQKILDAPPSTGFYAGQTHEDALGATLEEQDAFAYLLFEKGLPIDRIVDEYGASREFAETMHGRYRVSHHKRLISEALPHVTLFRPNSRQ